MFYQVRAPSGHESKIQIPGFSPSLAEVSRTSTSFQFRGCNMSTLSRLLREPHFIEGRGSPAHPTEASRSRLLREPHFIEGARTRMGRYVPQVAGRGSSGSRTSLRAVVSAAEAARASGRGSSGSRTSLRAAGLSAAARPVGVASRLLREPHFIEGGGNQPVGAVVSLVAAPPGAALH